LARTSGELSAREEGEIERLRVRERYRLGRTLIRGVAVVGGLYLAQPALMALTGKETILALKLSIFGDFKFVASITLAGLAAAWAAAERYLRHRKVEQLQSRISQLEKKLDPSRSSSNLTTRGKTNPKDDGP
jgi:hypothetical protein